MTLFHLAFPFVIPVVVSGLRHNADALTKTSSTLFQPYAVGKVSLKINEEKAYAQNADLQKRGSNRTKTNVKEFPFP